MPEVLHHESAGAEDAPVLLLGCSLGTALAMWEPQVAPLAEQLRARFVADSEAIYSYEGTREINSLIVGLAITGESAFVGR